MTRSSSDDLKGFDNVALDAPVFLLGMPRSGTTWLSQIFDASEAFVVRLSPNYSYELKNSIGIEAGLDDWRRHLRAALLTESAFSSMDWLRDTGEIEHFGKAPAAARWLLIKDTRFHALYLGCMTHLPAAKCIYIVRHPCGALNSWRKCKEFPPDGVFEDEWRFGKCRKREGAGEYWGFEDWRVLAELYLGLQDGAPERFRIVRYEHMVAHPAATAQELFDFVGVEMTDASRDFLRRSHSRHDERTYAVHKSPQVADEWRTELPAGIRLQIERSLRGTRLERFLS